MLKITALLLFLAGFAAAQEIHGGVTYDIRWDNTSAISTTNSNQGRLRDSSLQSGHSTPDEIPKVAGVTPNCLAANNGSTPADLFALEDCIAADNIDNFFTLLAPDIYNSYYFWDKVVSESTTDRTQWKPARVYVRSYFGSSLSATQFALWTQSSKADAANSHTNPEHYYKRTQVTGPTSQNSTMLEGWGGVLSTLGTKRTNFTIPNYSIPAFGSPEYLAAWSLSSDFNPQL
jgi:hypothetical protein